VVLEKLLYVGTVVPSLDKEARVYKKTYTGISIYNDIIQVDDIIFKIDDCKILDLGCGDMNYAKEIKSNIVGVDIYDIKNNIVGDVCDLSTWNNFNDEQFDLIISLSSAHWFGKNTIWVKESFKKLKNNGKIFYYILHEDMINKRGFRIIGMPEHILSSNSWLLLNQNSAYKLFNEAGFNILNVKETESLVNQKIVKYIVIIGEK